MSVPCVPCNGTGVVIVWNLKDESGDSPDVCGDCGGYGYINDTKTHSN